MPVLPMHCSVKLHTGRACLFPTTTQTTNTRDVGHHQRLRIKNKPKSQDFSYLKKMPNGLVAAEPTLIKEYPNEENGMLKTTLEEVASIINRLTTVVERLREREMQKFMSRVNGEVTYEDSVRLAEMTSKDIVDTFLERPKQYLLRSGGRSLEKKLKDVNFLVEILQNSCPANQR